jgi:hypothetical protein
MLSMLLELNPLDVSAGAGREHSSTQQGLKVNKQHQGWLQRDVTKHPVVFRDKTQQLHGQQQGTAMLAS